MAAGDQIATKGAVLAVASQQVAVNANVLAAVFLAAAVFAATDAAAAAVD